MDKLSTYYRQKMIINNNNIKKDIMEKKKTPKESIKKSDKEYWINSIEKDLKHKIPEELFKLKKLKTKGTPIEKGDENTLNRCLKLNKYEHRKEVDPIKEAISLVRKTQESVNEKNLWNNEEVSIIYTKNDDILIGYEVETSPIQFTATLPAHLVINEEDTEYPIKVRMEIDRTGVAGPGFRAFEIVLPPISRNIKFDTMVSAVTCKSFMSNVCDQKVVDHLGKKYSWVKAQKKGKFRELKEDKPSIKTIDMNVCLPLSKIEQAPGLNMKGKKPYEIVIELFLAPSEDKKENSGLPLLKTHPFHLIGLNQNWKKREFNIEFVMDMITKKDLKNATQKVKSRVDSLIKGLKIMYDYNKDGVVLPYLELMRYAKYRKREKNELATSNDWNGVLSTQYLGWRRSDILVVPIYNLSYGEPMVVLEYRQLEIKQAKELKVLLKDIK